jgi:uncharacterized cupredoxin-like copper-binding protein
MSSRLRELLAAAFLLLLSATAAVAADPSATVRVALLDMTAVAGPGAGVGMMAPGGGGSPWGGYGWGNGMMGGGGGGWGPGMTGGGMMGNGPAGGGMMGGGGWGGGMMGGGMMGRGMMSIRADSTSVKAGAIVFDVTNWSRSLTHEMAVVAVDGADAPLPYDYNAMRVVEEQVTMAGETGELAPSASKTLELTLKPGSYLLICNLPGHYAAGMALPFTVAP